MVVNMRRPAQREKRAQPMACSPLGKLIPILSLGYTGALLLHRRLLGLYGRLLAVRSLVSLRCDLFVHCQRLLVSRANYWRVQRSLTGWHRRRLP